MSFPMYPVYKDSGEPTLGEIPADWRIVRVGDVVRVVNGYPFDARLFDDAGTYPLIRIRDLGASDTATRYSGEFVESAAVSSSDVLIGMDGDFNVGRWKGPGPALLNQRMCCIRASSSVVVRYLEFVLPGSLRIINDLTYATTVKHLSSSQVEKIRVALPPTDDELICVVDFLDRETTKVDALVAEQEQLITLLNEKRQAVISHAVTKGLDPSVPMKDSGVEWIGMIPAHWRAIALKRLVQPNSSISYGIVQPGEPLDHGVPFVQTTNMSSGQFALDDLQKTSAEIASQYPRSQLGGGEVILGIRASIGSAYVVPSFLAGANLSRGVARIECSERLAPEFLVNYLASCSVDAYWNIAKQGSTFNEVSIETVRELLVTLPPQAEQREINCWLKGQTESFDELISEARVASKLLQERRSALISAAVTGQIDVRGLATDKETV